MNVDESLWPDRRIDFETDDEENEAERVCDNDDDTDSAEAVQSQYVSNTCVDNTLWPQSFRQSMDMLTGKTPPTVSYLTGPNLTRVNVSFSTSPLSNVQPSLPDSPLNKPLICEPSLEEVPTSYLPTKISAISQLSRFSTFGNELPASHRQQCSYAQSLLNAINVLCGIGLLSTPYALKEGGWWSMAILFILGAITCYTGILLKRCLESGPGLQTYPDIGQAAFGVPGRICFSIILYMELYSSCVEYLIMMSDNLSALFPSAHMHAIGIELNSYQICTIVSTLIILPTVWLRNLSLLSFISVGGVLNAILVSLCLLWVGVVDKVGFHSNGHALDIAKLPVTIGLFGFCYGSHSVFPNIYTSMKEPSRFPSVLIISFVVSCLMYAGVGVAGFMMFGESIKSQFTLNMPTEYVASNIATWTTVAAPVTKFALTVTPIAYGLEELLPEAQLRSHGVSILIRTLIMLSSLVVALAVPYFGSVMAFIGSLLVMVVAVVFPCACYLKICRGRLAKSEVLTCFIIMAVGIVCAVVGTYSAVTNTDG
ncbi:hypothetical protein NMG60_11005386 [Bertholletia excelsa]